jgi:hypothetical protein
VTAYSFGQQLAMTGFNVALGLFALLTFFGRGATRLILEQARRGRKKGGEEPSREEEAEALARSLGAASEEPPPGARVSED